MKEYNVYLHRDYLVKIKAKSKNEARTLTELFIGNERDCSIEADRIKHRFEINEIEMVSNDATEVHGTNEVE